MEEVRCVLSKEHFYLEHVQVATLFLPEITNVGYTLVRQVLQWEVSPFCTVCEQPAEIIELCVAVTISAHSCKTRYQNGKCPFLYGLCATGETFELCVAETIVVHSCEATKMIHNVK